MNPLIGRYILVVSASLLLTLSLTCCSGTGEKKAESALTLFKEASVYYENKKYWQAREIFQEVKDNYPLSKYATIAELRIADSYYYNKKYSEALLHYEDFKKLHPTNPEIPYIVYQSGMTYFNQILSKDRDQTFTRNAAKQFEYLISTYPSNAQTASAQEKLDTCREKLAEHEFYVGHFYFKTKRYVVALLRFNELVKAFPKSSLIDRTYLYIGKSYLSLNDKEKAREAFTSLLQNYSDSKYSGEAQVLLTQIN